MKVSELRAKLAELPQEAKVGIVYDGCHRCEVDVIYLAHSGAVLVTSQYDYVSGQEDMPLSVIAGACPHGICTPYDEVAHE